MLGFHRFSSSEHAGHRFGFNGMEKDGEVHNVSGSSYDFGARMYSSRLGSWFSVDPYADKYSYLSPYNFVASNPIKFIDPNGKEIIIHDSDGKPITYRPGMKPQGSQFTQDIINGLNDINRTPEGAAVVNRLAKSEAKYNIFRAPVLHDADNDWGGSHFQAYNANYPSDKEPLSRGGTEDLSFPEGENHTGGQLAIFDGPTQKHPLDDSKREFSFINILSHELYHAYQRDLGLPFYLLMREDFIDPTWFAGRKIGLGVRAAEIQAIGFENYITAHYESDRDPRMSYGGRNLANDGIYSVQKSLFGLNYAGSPSLSWFKSFEGVAAWKFLIPHKAEKKQKEKQPEIPSVRDLQ